MGPRYSYSMLHKIARKTEVQKTYFKKTAPSEGLVCVICFLAHQLRVCKNKKTPGNEHVCSSAPALQPACPKLAALLWPLARSWWPQQQVGFLPPTLKVGGLAQSTFHCSSPRVLPKSARQRRLTGSLKHPARGEATWLVTKGKKTHL